MILFEKKCIDSCKVGALEWNPSENALELMIENHIREIARRVDLRGLVSSRICFEESVIKGWDHSLAGFEILNFQLTCIIVVPSTGQPQVSLVALNKEAADNRKSLVEFGAANSTKMINEEIPILGKLETTSLKDLEIRDSSLKDDVLKYCAEVLLEVQKNLEKPSIHITLNGLVCFLHFLI